MNIFGIGPTELLLILILALLIFGPKDLQKTGKMLGSTLNKIVHSDIWQMFRKTRTEISNLPNRLMREAGVDELSKTTGKAINDTVQDLEKVTRSLEPNPAIRPPAIPAPQEPSASEEDTGK